ncbi:MAG: hypothetical protein E3K32_07270 [wastewater metagenome]|nr:hypothetical protein [Candidatus Loosdrechtia aerotolerans]
MRRKGYRVQKPGIGRRLAQINADFYWFCDLFTITLDFVLNILIKGIKDNHEAGKTTGRLWETTPYASS